MARLAWLICQLHHTLYTAPYNPPISGKLCLKPAGASSESGRRRRHKSKEDLLVKTYCKPAEVNIENLDFIKGAGASVLFTGKRSKRRFQNLLVSTGKITRAELREEIRNCTCNKSLTAIDAVAEQAMPIFWPEVFPLSLCGNSNCGKMENFATSARKVRGSRFLNILQRERSTRSFARCCRSSMEVCPEGTDCREDGRTNASFAGCSITRPMPQNATLKKGLSFHDSRMRYESSAPRHRKE